MAKKFNEVLTQAKKTTYGELDNALVLAASLNSMVKFTPVLAPNGIIDAGATTAEYNIFMAKRNKSQTIGKAGDIATSVDATDGMTTADNLKVLDAFGKIEWDNEGVATGKLRGIGHKIGFNTKYDADDQSAAQQDFISSEVGNEAITRKEDLIEAIVAGGTVENTELSPATDPAGKTPIRDAAVKAVSTVRKVSDDFKHRSAPKNMLILVDTDTKDAIAKEIGQSFHNEAPIYTTGLKSKFSINGTPVLEVAELDSFKSGSTTATASVGMIVLDIETLAFKSGSETKGVDVNLGVTRFVGDLFYAITKVLTFGKSAERIRIFGNKDSTTLIPLVNA